MRSGQGMLGAGVVAGGFLAALAAWAGEGGTVAAAKPDPDALAVTFGGFVDFYYLYDFNRPLGLDRTLANGKLYATTGERSNEFNLNLAYVEAKVSSDRVRGRLALQTGSSVQANYAGEVDGLGLIHGPLPQELIQEAVAGYRIADGLWVDGGIFFSHLGFESFISRDNWNYTRSLIAELSPYYETGVKLSYQISPIWSAQLLLLNGWQIISETNTAKSVGVQLSYNPSERWTLTYNDYLGEEPGGFFRVFNELIGRMQVCDPLQLALTFDEGTQTRNGAGSSFWYGAALLGRWQLGPKLALGGRVERYSDPDGVIVSAGTPNGFAVTGFSVNLDAQLHKSLLWRNEARVLIADQDATFAGIDGPQTSDKFVVSSLALSF